MGNERQENQESEGVQPPVDRAARGAFAVPQAAEIGHHEGEDKESDEAGFRRDGAEPFGPHQEAPHEQSRDGDSDSDRPYGYKSEIETAERGPRRKEWETESRSQVIQGDERECAEAPEDESVREARQGPLADHFALRHHLPKKLGDARTEGRHGEIGSDARAADDVQYAVQPDPKTRQ